MRFAKVASLGMVALLVAACGGVLSIPSIPAIPSFGGLPSGETLPPGVIPSASGTCTLVSADEVSAAMGSTATLSDTDNGCTFVLSNFSSVVLSIETDTDLSTIKVLMGSTAKDLTIAGLPAVSGAVFGQAAVYVQKGGSQLQVLGILTGSDDATIAKIAQIATLAAGRLP